MSRRRATLLRFIPGRRRHQDRTSPVRRAGLAIKPCTKRAFAPGAHRSEARRSQILARPELAAAALTRRGDERCRTRPACRGRLCRDTGPFAPCRGDEGDQAPDRDTPASHRLGAAANAGRARFLRRQGEHIADAEASEHRAGGTLPCRQPQIHRRAWSRCRCGRAGQRAGWELEPQDRAERLSRPGQGDPCGGLAPAGPPAEDLWPGCKQRRGNTGLLRRSGDGEKYSQRGRCRQPPRLG